MADDATLTAGNGTEASAASATDTAGASASAGAGDGKQPDAGTQAQPDGKQAETDAQKPQQGAPEAYEYKLPEGYTLNDETKAGFETMARELNLSNEGAQKLIDMHTALLKQSQDSFAEAVTAQQEQWLNTTKSDKEIGGAKLKEVSALTSQVIDKLGTPELKAALNETGIGNHPEVVRFVYRIAQELGMKEGQIVANGSGAAVQKEAKDILFSATT